MKSAEYYLNKLWQILKQDYAGLTSIQTTSAETARGPANTDVVITYAAEEGVSHAISGIIYSYEVAQAGIAGRLTIMEGTTMLFDATIYQRRPYTVPFSRGMRGSEGMAMTITLHAAGAGIIGRLNVMNHWTE